MSGDVGHLDARRVPRRGGDGEPCRGEHATGLLGEPCFGVLLLLLCCVEDADHVAKVGDEFPAFGCGDVRLDQRREARTRERPAMPLLFAGMRPRVSADPRHSDHRPRGRDDDTRFQVACRDPDRHSDDAIESAQRRVFAREAVLKGEDRQVGHDACAVAEGHPGDLRDGGLGILRFHGQHDRVRRERLGLGDRRDDIHRDHLIALGTTHPHAAAPDRLVGGPAGDERHRDLRDGPLRGQQRPEGSRADDDVATHATASRSVRPGTASKSARVYSCSGAVSTRAAGPRSRSRPLRTTATSCATCATTPRSWETST